MNPLMSETLLLVSAYVGSEPANAEQMRLYVTRNEKEQAKP